MYEINKAAVIDAGTKLSENDICALAQVSETTARIEPLLNTGTPLRN